jgi:hypothetical protein
MAAAAAPEKTDKATKPANSEYAPPEEQFWQKYSPHYEFPIANVASIALHVLAVVVIIYITTTLMKTDEKTPVPTRGMVIQDDTPGNRQGGPGSGGVEARKEADDHERPQEVKVIPEAQLKKELVSAKSWTPELNDDALQKIVQSPGYEKLKDVNEDIKKRLSQGFSGNAKKGSGMGSGMDDTGGGPGGKTGTGDASTSGNRSIRWTIVFNTSSGKNYLEQLNAFKAKVVIPEPPKWKTNRLFEVITEPNPGKPLADQDLPKMYFVDEKAESAAKVAEALGLDFKPPNFIAFFPKEVENELAAKETSYRNRREDQVYSTTFRVLNRDGKHVITVTDQISMDEAKRKGWVK